MFLHQEQNDCLVVLDLSIEKKVQLLSYTYKPLKNVAETWKPLFVQAAYTFTAILDFEQAYDSGCFLDRTRTYTEMNVGFSKQFLKWKVALDGYVLELEGKEKCLTFACQPLFLLKIVPFSMGKR